MATNTTVRRFSSPAGQASPDQIPRSRRPVSQTVASLRSSVAGSSRGPTPAVRLLEGRRPKPMIYGAGCHTCKRPLAARNDLFSTRRPRPQRRPYYATATDSVRRPRSPAAAMREQTHHVDVDPREAPRTGPGPSAGPTRPACMNWPGVCTMVSVGPSTMSFSPEKTHAEFAWSCACVGPPVGGIAGVVSVLGFPGGPFTSPARAALALAPTSAAVQAATPSNDLKRILTSTSRRPRAAKAPGPVRIVVQVLPPFRTWKPATVVRYRNGGIACARYPPRFRRH